MPKVTITRADGQRMEITELTFEQIKELVGVNGVSHSPTSPSIERKGASLKPGDFEPDYVGFKKRLTTKARQFLSILRQNPNGISADHLADQLGFKNSTQIGGMAGGGMGKIAPQFGVRMENVYSKDIKFGNGLRKVIYRPGKDIHLVT